MTEEFIKIKEENKVHKREIKKLVTLNSTTELNLDSQEEKL